MTPIRVAVVDDHMIFREGLRALLGRADDIEIVGEAATTQEAIEVADTLHPDVVLMDLNLPGGGGEVATTEILAAHPEVAVLVLTMHSDDAHLRHALNAGARGYLLKDAEPDAIVRAGLAVNEGQAIFDRGIAAQVIAATGTLQAERPFPVLTDREFEILDRLPRTAKRCDLSPDGHQHENGAEQRVLHPAQARRRRPRSGCRHRPRRGNGAPPITLPAPRRAVRLSRRISRRGVDPASCRPGIRSAIVK
jgi:DNA-binding NarL/FixJ family response regulator